MHHNVLSYSQGNCAFFMVEMSYGNNLNRVIVSHSVYIPSTDLRLTFFRPPWFNLSFQKDLFWLQDLHLKRGKTPTPITLQWASRDWLPAVVWSLRDSNTSYPITRPMTALHGLFLILGWHCSSRPPLLSIRQGKTDKRTKYRGQADISPGAGMSSRP